MRDVVRSSRVSAAHSEAQEEKRRMGCDREYGVYRETREAERRKI